MVIAHEPQGMTWCDSKADSIVWIKEEAVRIFCTQAKGPGKRPGYFFANLFILPERECLGIFNFPIWLPLGMVIKPR